ncbi:TetR/AcrR family transcriptional regulator [Rhizobium sp. RU36D]|uniref:TetR/AcrR family transcriptional regulator n=1 Tax=Rhizobium sp. RU36D TaxID=1907415 RepID=UPI0009D7CC60|nr:TetR/AcrR family transcriptional regulator [Rhizobium sp. RU36D]SMD20775.1 transcriptional regulator, TetR family [Rhizobium sp. RU36D]
MSTALPSPSAPRAAGRPREFDLDRALDRAIVVFSERGYQGASISELKSAMGVAAGSLYKAFPDKRAIFLAALERYKTLRDAVMRERVEAGQTGRDKVEHLLSVYADASLGTSGRTGCLIVASATEMALMDEEAAGLIAQSVSRNHGFVCDLIRLGQADGSIGSSVDPEVTARTLLSLAQGLRVLGKTGIAPAEARAVVQTAMKLLD